LFTLVSFESASPGFAGQYSVGLNTARPHAGRAQQRAARQPPKPAQPQQCGGQQINDFLVRVPWTVSSRREGEGF
jgi:hypothetical protein